MPMPVMVPMPVMMPSLRDSEARGGNLAVGDISLRRYCFERNAAVTGESKGARKDIGASGRIAAVCRVENRRPGRCSCDVHQHASPKSPGVGDDYRRQHSDSLRRICVILRRSEPASINKRPKPYVYSPAIRRQIYHCP